jgi:hypothetical protein
MQYKVYSATTQCAPLLVLNLVFEFVVFFFMCEVKKL